MENPWGRRGHLSLQNWDSMKKTKMEKAMWQVVCFEGSQGRGEISMVVCAATVGKSLCSQFLQG